MFLTNSVFCTSSAQLEGKHVVFLVWTRPNKQQTCARFLPEAVDYCCTFFVVVGTAFASCKWISRFFCGLQCRDALVCKAYLFWTIRGYKGDVFVVERQICVVVYLCICAAMFLRWCGDVFCVLVVLVWCCFCGGVLVVKVLFVLIFLQVG